MGLGLWGLSLCVQPFHRIRTKEYLPPVTFWRNIDLIFVLTFLFTSSGLTTTFPNSISLWIPEGRGRGEGGLFRLTLSEELVVNVYQSLGSGPCRGSNRASLRTPPQPPPRKPSPNIRGLGAEGRKTGQRIVAGRLGRWSNERAWFTIPLQARVRYKRFCAKTRVLGLTILRQNRGLSRCCEGAEQLLTQLAAFTAKFC